MAAPFPSPVNKWHDNTYPAISPTRPELSAEGKHIVITGGGTGIGAATALAFAQAGAARISILGRREAPLVATATSIRSSHPATTVLYASADIADPTAIAAAFKHFTTSEGGADKVDVLIHNAAVTGPLDAIPQADAAAFMEAVNINVGGSLTVAQEFLKHAATDAVVVEVNSMSAFFAIGGAFAAYSVSKLAQWQVWRYVKAAVEGLRVYHIQPGVVDTDMNKKAGGVAALGFEDHVSLPANHCVWLASQESLFLDGKFLFSNWDVEELKERSAEFEGSKLSISLVGWPFGQDFTLKTGGEGGDHWKN